MEAPEEEQKSDCTGYHSLCNADRRIGFQIELLNEQMLSQYNSSDSSGDEDDNISIDSDFSILWQRYTSYHLTRQKYNDIQTQDNKQQGV